MSSDSSENIFILFDGLYQGTAD